jgi:hypothetical protein
MEGEEFREFGREDNFEEVMGVLRHFLDDVQLEEDNYVWYTNRTSLYYGDNQELRRLTDSWRRYVEWKDMQDEEEEDNAIVQLKVQRDRNGNYVVWIEPFLDGDEVNVFRDLPMRVTVNENLLGDVLEIFYESGSIYNSNLDYIINW